MIVKIMILKPILELMIRWACAVCLTVPVAVNADNFIFTTNSDNTVTITGYTGTNRDVAIPSIIQGLPVTRIGSCAFMETRDSNTAAVCHKLTSAMIPSSITNIGEFAFYGCYHLTNVVFPSCITSIGESSFSGCARLANIKLPKDLISIGPAAFANCLDLTSVIVPAGMSEIADETFAQCDSLTNVALPNGVVGIGCRAFFQCNKLSDIAIPGSATNIGQWAFGFCTNLANVSLPNGVTTIGGFSFYMCKLNSVTLPNTVNWIQGGAFESCPLRDVFFLGNAPFGDFAFGGSTNLVMHYMTGTTGWSTTFAGCPTIIWHPQTNKAAQRGS